MRALRELGVRSPLRECGVTKAGIRAQAKAAGIALWDKPSYACLATRIPAGTPITREDLRRVEEGEALLMDLGYIDFRLRLRGDYALFQVREADLDRAAAELPMLQQKLRHILPQVVLDSVPAAKPRILTVFVVLIITICIGFFPYTAWEIGISQKRGRTRDYFRARLF